MPHLTTPSRKESGHRSPFSGKGKEKREGAPWRSLYPRT